MEKRNFTRVVFRTEALVTIEGRQIRGEVENLSMNGMFLRTTEKVARDESLDIKICLSGASSELSIDLKGNVIRQDDDGIAIQFRGMDLDSFIHLKNTVAYNRGDENEIMEEVYKSIERKKLEGL
jgi:hypothetical protein